MSKNTKTKFVVEGVSRLIESDLERAELVIAAQAITDKLQKMAEDAAKIEADDVMPMLDALKSSFGPQVSDNFSKVASEQLRNLTTALKTAKDGIGGEIGRLENVVNGGSDSDMALDAPADDMAAPTPDATAPEAPEADMDAEAPAAGGEEDAVASFIDDEEPNADQGFAGRPKKMESIKRRGRRLSESAALSHSFALWYPKAADLAKNIEIKINDLALPGHERQKLMQLLTDIALSAPNESQWTDGAEANIEAALERSGVDARIPENRAVVADIKKLAHMIALKHEETIEAQVPEMRDETNMPVGAKPFQRRPEIVSDSMMYETRAIKALRESANPDLLILTTFRRLLKESKLGPAACAMHCAKTFGVDYTDVVSIIKEAKDDANEKEADRYDRLGKEARNQNMRGDAAAKSPEYYEGKAKEFRGKEAKQTKAPFPAKVKQVADEATPTRPFQKAPSKNADGKFDPNRFKKTPHPVAAADATNGSEGVAMDVKAPKTSKASPAPNGSVTLMSAPVRVSPQNESQLLEFDTKNIMALSRDALQKELVSVKSRISKIRSSGKKPSKSLVTQERVLSKYFGDAPIKEAAGVDSGVIARWDATTMHYDIVDGTGRILKKDVTANPDRAAKLAQKVAAGGVAESKKSK